MTVRAARPARTEGLRTYVRLNRIHPGFSESLFPCLTTGVHSRAVLLKIQSGNRKSRLWAASEPCGGRGRRAQSLYCAGRSRRSPSGLAATDLAERRNKAIAPYDLTQRETNPLRGTLRQFQFPESTDLWGRVKHAAPAWSGSRDRALGTPWLTKAVHAFVKVRSGGILYELTAYFGHSQPPAWWPQGLPGSD